MVLRTWNNVRQIEIVRHDRNRRDNGNENNAEKNSLRKGKWNKKPDVLEPRPSMMKKKKGL